MSEVKVTTCAGMEPEHKAIHTGDGLIACGWARIGERGVPFVATLKVTAYVAYTPDGLMGVSAPHSGLEGVRDCVSDAAVFEVKRIAAVAPVRAVDPWGAEKTIRIVDGEAYEARRKALAWLDKPIAGTSLWQGPTFSKVGDAEMWCAADVLEKTRRFGALAEWRPHGAGRWDAGVAVEQWRAHSDGAVTEEKSDAEVEHAVADAFCIHSLHACSDKLLALAVGAPAAQVAAVCKAAKHYGSDQPRYDVVRVAFDAEMTGGVVDLSTVDPFDDHNDFEWDPADEYHIIKRAPRGSR